MLDLASSLWFLQRHSVSSLSISILHSLQGCQENTSPRGGPEMRTTEFVLFLEVRGHLLGTGVAGPIAVVLRDLWKRRPITCEFLL